MSKLKFRLLMLAGLLVLLSGCATKAPLERKDYAEFRKSDPRSMLVVPVVSRSVDVDAPDYFLSTIAFPLAERGYYVFPVNMVKRLMEDDGLADANLVHNSDATRLAGLFGADTVMYIVIERWDAQYAVFGTTTTVELGYTLKSGKTGQVLWRGTEKLAYDPAGAQNGLLAKAIAAAIEKAKPNYIPMARQVNNNAVNRLGQGLPAGPYDLKYQKDQAEF